MFTLIRIVAILSRNPVPTPWALALLCIKPFDIGKLFAPRRPETKP